MNSILPLLIVAAHILGSRSQNLTLGFKIHFNDGTVELIPSKKEQHNGDGISFTGTAFNIEPKYFLGENTYALIYGKPFLDSLGLADRINDVKRIEVEQGKCRFTREKWYATRAGNYSENINYNRDIRIKRVDYPAYLQAHNSSVPTADKKKMGFIKTTSDYRNTYALIYGKPFLDSLGLADRINDVKRIEVEQGKCRFTREKWYATRAGNYSENINYNRDIRIKRVDYPAYLQAHNSSVPTADKKKMGFIKTTSDYSYDIVTTKPNGKDETPNFYIEFKIPK